jgi:hypothetical protein
LLDGKKIEEVDRNPDSSDFLDGAFIMMDRGRR